MYIIGVFISHLWTGRFDRPSSAVHIDDNLVVVRRPSVEHSAR